ncbi:hypothetical protein A2U01_0115589, partial [Trifolium medium]|nr:hypothetical protein [Trifolium medium]
PVSYIFGSVPVTTGQRTTKHRYEGRASGEPPESSRTTDQ